MSAAEARDLIGREVVVLHTVNGSLRSLGSGGKWVLTRIENGDTLVVERSSVHRIPLTAVRTITPLRPSM